MGYRQDPVPRTDSRTRSAFVKTFTTSAPCSRRVAVCVCLSRLDVPNRNITPLDSSFVIPRGVQVFPSSRSRSCSMLDEYSPSFGLGRARVLRRTECPNGASWSPARGWRAAPTPGHGCLSRTRSGHGRAVPRCQPSPLPFVLGKASGRRVIITSSPRLQSWPVQS